MNFPMPTMNFYVEKDDSKVPKSIPEYKKKDFSSGMHRLDMQIMSHKTEGIDLSKFKNLFAELKLKKTGKATE